MLVIEKEKLEVLKQQVRIQEERLKIRKEQLVLQMESVNIFRDVKTSLEQIATGIVFY